MHLHCFISWSTRYFAPRWIIVSIFCSRVVGLFNFSHCLFVFLTGTQKKVWCILSARVDMETIFAGDLSFFCTEENLESLFSSFGVVRSAIIRRGKGGENLQYGFVQMEESEARKAVAQLKGQKFMGRKLRLNIAENSNDRSVPPDRNNLIKVLVSFVSHSVRTLQWSSPCSSLIFHVVAS